MEAQYPIPLSSVCSKWRHVAFLTSKSWTSVSFTVLFTNTSSITSLLPLHYENIGSLTLSVELSLQPCLNRQEYCQGSFDQYRFLVDPTLPVLFHVERGEPPPALKSPTLVTFFPDDHTRMISGIIKTLLSRTALGLCTFKVLDRVQAGALQG
jgi:hypothetical protein